MSQEGGLGKFSWDTQRCAFSNFNMEGGSDPKLSFMSGKKDNKEDKKAMESRFNNSTGPPTSLGEKRGRNGVPKSRSGAGRGIAGLNEAKIISGCGEPDHEMHIWNERERRKKMKEMFSHLHALLPNLPSKADKSTIVDEAVNHIKNLQQTLQQLEKQKMRKTQGEELAATMAVVQAPVVEDPSLSREAFVSDQAGKNQLIENSPIAMSVPTRLHKHYQTWCSPNLVLNVAGGDAHISICHTKKPNFLSTIFSVFEKHQLEVLSIHISSDYFRSMCMIHARVTRVSDQFPGELMIEELFKLAVGEFLQWLSS